MLFHERLGAYMVHECFHKFVFMMLEFLFLYMFFPYIHAQVESAFLDRSYRRAPQGAGDRDYGNEGAGICHLCTCGTGIDWEDLLPGCLLANLLKLVFQHASKPKYHSEK